MCWTSLALYPKSLIGLIRVSLFLRGNILSLSFECVQRIWHTPRITPVPTFLSLFRSGERHEKFWIYTLALAVAVICAHFVHPLKEVRASYSCTEAEALLAKGALGAVCNHLT
jgi:hypothetical protein